MRVLGLCGLAVLVIACGSGGGVGDDDAQVVDDSGTGGPDVTTGTDSGNPQKDSGTIQDSTVEVGPSSDATLDINVGDAIWTADSQGGGGNDGATDTGTGCAPDGILCNGNTAEICKNGSLSTQVCANGLVCADGYGCVTCVPGSGTCNGSNASLCNSQGTGYITSTCDSQLGLSCQAGVCVGDCANIGQSYIGCEYYAVTMLNDLLDQGVFTFKVAVANTTTKSTTVNITGPHAVPGNPFTIAANTIQTITLPWESPLSCGPTACNGANDNPATTALVTGGAYHIKSTEPVTVYQFNAYDYQINSSCSSGNINGGLGSPPCYSFTNDASLLIPVNALTGTYYAASSPSWDDQPGLITVVGTQASTSVTVSPTATIVAGGGLASNGGTVTLGAGDVLQITNPTPGSFSYGGDMSGTSISANAPVSVFGGHACTFYPASTYACDHIEETVFPYETLQKDYLVVPPNMTSITTTKKPSHFVRIIGTAANTTITYQPAPTVTSGTAATTVGKGGVVLFETPTPIHVTTSQPVLISMYMEGANNYGGNVLNGDPAMSVAVATGQFRNSYAFTAPNNYSINWATVIAPTGNSVTIDTTTIAANQFTAIGTSGYGYYHYQICSGNCGNSSANHTASSANAFGIQVYGYGNYTSYWYPGGLNLTR